jgi:hypothetical protein
MGITIDYKSLAPVDRATKTRIKAPVKGQGSLSLYGKKDYEKAIPVCN